MYDKEFISDNISKELIDEKPSKELLTTSKELLSPSEELLLIDGTSSIEASPKTIRTSSGTNRVPVSGRKIASKNGPYWTPERLEEERKAIEAYARKRWEIDSQKERECRREQSEKELEEIVKRWKERRLRKGKL